MRVIAFIRNMDITMICAIGNSAAYAFLIIVHVNSRTTYNISDAHQIKDVDCKTNVSNWLSLYFYKPVFMSD